MRQIAIIGGGSWGTALSLVLGRKGHPIRLWVFEQELVASINRERRNALYLSEFELPDCVSASHSLEEVLDGADIVLTVVPSHHCRDVYQSMLTWLHPEMVLVSATKGIENESLMRMSEVISVVTKPIFPARVAVISGPSFAKEVAKGDPTAIVVASEDLELAQMIQQEFSGPALRLYTNTDVAGVELGGAVKNVIAIAAGVCSGLGFGFNSLAALVTRGLSEMTRLAVACGGRRDTLGGLAGMGDLMLTCTGELSRNRSLILVAGALASSLAGTGALAAWERVLTRLPLARIIYSATKSLGEAFLSGRRTAFRQVLLVEYPRPGVWVIGFRSADPPAELSQKAGVRLVSVFVPNTPNPTSGYFRLMPETNVKPLDLTIEQAFKLIASAGVVQSPPHPEPKHAPHGPDPV